MEETFFITEYLNTERNKLKCTIKQLYSDFIVNEITAEGIVIDVPFPCSMGTITEDKNTTKDSVEMNEIAKPKCITEKMVQEIDALLLGQSNFVEIPTEENIDKQNRTVIHAWIRDRYNGLLDSRTVTNAIRVSVPNKQSRKRKQWPADRPDFVHFTLCKENKDTYYAISVIAKLLGMKNSSFGICGTKDRRAVTTQRVSVYRCDIERLRELNTRLRGIRLTDFTPSSEACKLGDLWGNRFKIILRDVQQFVEADLIARLDDFKSKGFINYFGTQRFGSCGFNTAEIGLALLKKQWEVAVRAILRPRNAYGTIREALAEWNKSGNASAALKKLAGSQVYASIEGQLLSALSKNNYNYHSALMKLPRNARSLYVHAYQSLLWNKIASRRVQIKGIRAVAGDLNIDGHKIEDFEREEVALPLMSGSVRLPENEVREWYEQVMGEDGVTKSMFETLEREYAVGEVMRPLVIKPVHVKYKILAYPDATTKLQSGLEGKVDSESIGAGNFRAIALEFSLPSGAYATVALREITRCDMSKLAQMAIAKDNKDATGFA